MSAHALGDVQSANTAVFLSQLTLSLRPSSDSSSAMVKSGREECDQGVVDTPATDEVANNRRRKLEFNLVMSRTLTFQKRR
jgi:hypothetical protein